MKNLIRLLILIFFGFSLGGCDPQPAIAPSGKTIKVGIIAPLSGHFLSLGKEGLKGIESAMRLQPYLENGDRIELVVEDDKNDPSLTVELLKKLVEKDKVPAIITFSGSNPALEMSKIADNYKTPILAALATHPDITRQNDFISQVCFDDDFQGIVAALFVRDDLMVDSVAVFKNPSSAYSSHLASKFEQKFKSIGGEITDTVALPEEAGDLSEAVKSVSANNPELLYLPMIAKNVIRIIHEVRKLGWNPRIMGSDGLISTMLAQHAEELDLVDGMLAIDFFGHGMPLTPFGKRAKESFKGVPTIFAGLGIEAYAILRNAMNLCSDPANRDCINRQIRSTTNFSGIMGNITIESNGKSQRPLIINSIQGNRSKFIFKVY